jgi:hypothetical protein
MTRFNGRAAPIVSGRGVSGAGTDNGGGDDGNATVYVLMIARSSSQFQTVKPRLAHNTSQPLACASSMRTTHDDRIRFLWLSHNARVPASDYHV